MKIFAPKYYERFACTADKCKHSCCIGWEIDIDEETHSTYKMLDHAYGDAIRSSIDEQDVPHFALVDGKRCPHLDESGLCKIIKNVGEDCLCEICREHPRFYNDTLRGKEMGIGMSCEEACSLILQSDDYDVFIQVGEIEGEPSQIDFNAISLRDKIFSYIKSCNLPSEDKIASIADEYDCLMFDIPANELFSAMEYLDPSHKDLFLKFDEMTEFSHSDKEFERIFCYYVYRYCSAATNFVDFVVSLQIAYFLSTLIASICTPDNIEEMARIVSEEIEYSEDNMQVLRDYFDFDESCELVEFDENFMFD